MLTMEFHTSPLASWVRDPPSAWDLETATKKHHCYTTFNRNIAYLFPIVIYEKKSYISEARCTRERGHGSVVVKCAFKSERVPLARSVEPKPTPLPPLFHCRLDPDRAVLLSSFFFSSAILPLGLDQDCCSSPFQLERTDYLRSAAYFLTKYRMFCLVFHQFHIILCNILDVGAAMQSPLHHFQAQVL